MKRILTFTFVLSVLMPAFGQNYQSITSDRTISFVGTGNVVESVRIDSVFHEGDSVFYPFCNIQIAGDNCYLPFSYSWIGKKIIISDNGYNYFINKDEDTIKINTFAALDESWEAYKISDTLVVIATVSKHDVLSFLSQTDSVKTISFCAYNQNMDSVFHPVNEMNILLSKNFGLVKTLNFSFFTESYNPFSKNKLQSYSLIGLSNPEIGIVNITWKDIYNFDIGDEIHILEEDGKFVSVYESRTQKMIYIYLDKKIYEDSIVYAVDYEMERVRMVVESNTPVYDRKYVHDTIQMVYKPSLTLDKLSGEPIGNEMSLSNVRMTIGETHSKMFLDDYIEPNRWGDDSCWSYVIKDGCFTTDEYLEGLGGPYYSCSYGMNRLLRKLQYYKKGDIIRGTPLEMTDIEEYSSENSMRIYPNPASGYIFINIKDINSSPLFEMFDVQGKLVLSTRLQSEGETIDITHLFNGIYFYRLSTTEKQIHTGKIIKH